MIKSEKVEQIPREIFSCMNEHVLIRNEKTLSSLLAMSMDNRYLEDEEGRPLLIIGAFKLDLFSKRVELWMVATTHLGLQHLKECRKLVHEWIAKQDVEVLIRCKTGKPAQFLRVMGFQPKEV